jgi:AraC family transcriptional regulator
MTATQELTVKTLQPMRVVALRHIGPYQEIGPVWEKFLVWAKGHDLLGPGSETVMITWDDPCNTPPEKLRSDAALVVGDDFEIPEGAPENVSIREVNLGKCAVWMHQGHYSGLGKAWNDFAGEKMPAAGYVPREGPCAEFYRNDCQNTKPEDLLTELFAPIE